MKNLEEIKGDIEYLHSVYYEREYTQNMRVLFYPIHNLISLGIEVKFNPPQEGKTPHQQMLDDLRNIAPIDEVQSFEDWAIDFAATHPDEWAGMTFEEMEYLYRKEVL